MLQKINLLDLFSGIGGFHKGLEQAGFEIGWNGFSDIDKYANAVYQYNYPEAINLGSITTIRHKELPQIDCITFGSPCQDFSVAGKRSGMQGDRSSLITEAIRLIATLRPRFFIWENVKGTFSSNDGADFWAIIQAFTNIGGYRLEWQLLNTRWFLPQNRERIYLVGYIGEGSGSKVFPIGKIKNEDNRNNQLKEITKNMPMGYRVYDVSGMSTTLRAVGGGVGAKTGLYQVETLDRKQDSYDFNSRVYSDKGIAKTLAGDGGNNDNKTGLYVNNSEIRRLTPVECCRLQGFPDDWNEKGIIDGDAVKISDTQRYKQCGNAVTVDVVQAVAERIYAQETKPKNISTKP